VPGAPTPADPEEDPRNRKNSCGDGSDVPLVFPPSWEPACQKQGRPGRQTTTPAGLVPKEPRKGNVDAGCPAAVDACQYPKRVNKHVHWCEQTVDPFQECSTS